ncbi:hypothetical protein B0H11DRAFT_19419 [Mycena galericulata]|nr:hypothetical protein B0H11DRAFT_19419 [Mycena galericulata]
MLPSSSGGSRPSMGGGAIIRGVMPQRICEIETARKVGDPSLASRILPASFVKRLPEFPFWEFGVVAAVCVFPCLCRDVGALGRYTLPFVTSIYFQCRAYVWTKQGAATGRSRDTASYTPNLMGAPRDVTFARSGLVRRKIRVKLPEISKATIP